MTKKEKKKSMMMLVKNNILTQEIDSWSNYEYAMREESRLFFNNMSA